MVKYMLKKGDIVKIKEGTLKNRIFKVVGCDYIKGRKYYLVLGGKLKYPRGFPRNILKKL